MRPKVDPEAVARLRRSPWFDAAWYARTYADVARLPLPDTEAFQDNHLLYPQGLDFFFTAGTRIAALPRSTKVEGV